VDSFPNATIAEYGTYSYFTDGFSAVADKIKAEIYARGPVAAGVNAEPLVEYDGSIVYDTKFWHMMVNHVVSIVGWDVDPTTGEQYWIVRNSWYVKVVMMGWVVCCVLFFSVSHIFTHAHTLFTLPQGTILGSYGLLLYCHG
jgi:hypothetical protein